MHRTRVQPWKLSGTYGSTVTIRCYDHPWGQKRSSPLQHARHRGQYIALGLRRRAPVFYAHHLRDRRIRPDRLTHREMVRVIERGPSKNGGCQSVNHRCLILPPRKDGYGPLTRVERVRAGLAAGTYPLDAHLDAVLEKMLNALSRPTACRDARLLEATCQRKKRLT